MGDIAEEDIFNIIRIGTVDTIEQTLMKNPDLLRAIDVENEETTVLIYAVESGSLEKVSTVLKFGPDVNATNQYGMSALHSATKLGDKDCVDLLLERGAHFTKGMCGSPLAVAVYHGNLDLVEYFMSLGCDINCENLLAEAIMHSHETILEFLLNNGCEVNKRFDSTNALHIAAAKGDPKYLRLLLDAGADVDALDMLGSTALLISTRSGHTDAVRLLLEQGADPNLHDNSYSTLSACHYAAHVGQTECLKVLLRSGANPNVADNCGFTPLMRAICMQSHQTCLVLIFENCQVNCIDRADGLNHRHRNTVSSPLELAIQTNFLSVAKLLVLCGSNNECLAKAKSLLLRKNSTDKQENKLLELINERLHNPASLYLIVNLKVRIILGCPLSIKLSALTLPDSVKKSIQLRDQLDGFAGTVGQRVQQGPLANWMPALWINKEENRHVCN